MFPCLSIPIIGELLGRNDGRDEGVCVGIFEGDALGVCVGL